jgi:ribonuclease HI
MLWSVPNADAHSARNPAIAVPTGCTTVYTDGSCLGNPGAGGWAWAVPDGPYASGAAARTTNQRMEITAVLRALEALEGLLLVMSDSTYVVNCFRDRWYDGWRRRGWRNSAGKPVANRDLWEPLIALAVYSGRSIRFEWVKGHSGDPMNDRVDLLATQAAALQHGVSGDHP